MKFHNRHHTNVHLFRHQVDKLHDIIKLEDKFVEESILEPINDLPEMLATNNLRQFKVKWHIFSDPNDRGFFAYVKKPKICKIQDAQKCRP